MPASSIASRDNGRIDSTPAHTFAQNRSTLAAPGRRHDMPTMAMREAWEEELLTRTDPLDYRLAVAVFVAEGAGADDNRWYTDA
jgi:hypothetical protein